MKLHIFPIQGPAFGKREPAVAPVSLIKRLASHLKGCQTSRILRGPIAGILVIFLVAKGGLAGVSVASAEETSEARQVARKFLLEGAELYEQGEFAEALGKFEAAYAAFPSPKIFFNFGQAYRGLARHAEAIESFKRFLAEEPNAEPGLREAALSCVIELEPKVGAVEVTGGTRDADVFVDGRLVAKLPLTRPLLLDPGPHQVSIEKGGFTSISRRIEVSAGKRNALPGDLAPQPAQAISRAPDRPTDAVAPLRAPAREMPQSEATSLYKSWWLWSAAGIVAAGVVTALLLTRSPETYSCTDCAGTIKVP